MNIYTKATLEIIAGLIAFALAYYFMSEGGPNPTGGMFYLIAIAAPSAFVFVGLLELVTGKDFMEIAGKWDELAAWKKFVISIITILVAILILFASVYFFA